MGRFTRAILYEYYYCAILIIVLIVIEDLLKRFINESLCILSLNKYTVY